MNEEIQAYIDAATASLQEEIDMLREHITNVETASFTNIQAAIELVPQIVKDVLAAHTTQNTSIDYTIGEDTSTHGEDSVSADEQE